MTRCNFRLGILLLVLMLLPGLAACGGSRPAETPDAPPRVTDTVPTPTPEPDPIADRIAGMTLAQKAGQLLVAGIEGTVPGQDGAAAIQEVQAGGVILFRRNVESAPQLARLTNDLKALNEGQIPLFLCMDQEGGRVSRMPPEIEAVPAPLEFGKIEDPERRDSACYAMGSTLAELCSEFGISMDFAPALDVWSNPKNTVIGDRAYGIDAAAVSGAGVRAAYGLMDGGVIPVVKHFPGHGDTEVDSHVGLPVVEKSLEELEQLELRPFRAAVSGTAEGRGSVPAVMVGHILLKAVDETCPAAFSPEVVTGLLREELGFNGLVCTDDLTMGAVTGTYGLTEGAVMAVEAGCDLLLVCHGADNLVRVRDALVEAVDSGRLTEARLDESLYRILSLKAEYGLDNAPCAEPDIEALNRAVRDLKSLIF